MFNLPWYSWFNVLAIPLVLTCIWLEFNLAGFKSWFRRIVLLQGIACVAAVFLYWNQHLFNTLAPINYPIVALTSSLCVLSFGNLLYELILGVRYKVKPHPTMAQNQMATSNVAIDFDADELELDDVPGCKRREQVEKHLPACFDRNASGEERFWSAMGALGVETDPMVVRHESTYVKTILLTAAGYALVLVPPAWMSAQLF